MGRTSLDVALQALVLDADELAAKLVAMGRMGDPDPLPAYSGGMAGFAERLQAAADAGQAAIDASGAAAARVDAERVGGRMAAAALYAFQRKARSRLKAVTFDLEPHAAHAAERLREALVLQRPALRPGIASTRAFLDDLRRPGHPLRGHPLGEALEAEAEAVLDQAEAELTLIQDAEDRRAAATRARQASKEALIAEMRSFRAHWNAARLADPGLPRLAYARVHHRRARSARRRAASAASPDEEGAPTPAEALIEEAEAQGD